MEVLCPQSLSCGTWRCEQPAGPCLCYPLPSPTVHLNIQVCAVPPWALCDLPGLRLHVGAATDAFLDWSWTRFKPQTALFGICGDRLLATCPLCRGRRFLIDSAGKYWMWLNGLCLPECTDCRVWTFFSLFYCIKMTFPGFCRWRIWKNRVFSCAVS